MIKNLIVVFAVFCGFSIAQGAGLKVGDAVSCVTLTQILPDFTEVNGCISDAVNPKTEKAVVLDFMSIDCSYCIRDLPTISKLAQDLKGVATVRQVSLDESVADFKQWHKAMVDVGMVTYPFAMDPRNKTVAPYKIAGTPTVYVIKAGIVVYAHIGMLRAKDVEDIKKAVHQ